jgi:hypothetical protein
METTKKTIGRPEGLMKRKMTSIQLDADLPNKLSLAQIELRNQRGDKTSIADIVNDAIRHYLKLEGLEKC